MVGVAIPPYRTRPMTTSCPPRNSTTTTDAIKGYTQVPNHVLVSDRLSPGAKLTYAMLLKYAWQNDYCFPGQERLAKDMGVTDRSVRTYLQELEREQFITIKQRGLGKPNLYELNLSASAADRKKFPVRTRKKRAS